MGDLNGRRKLCEDKHSPTRGANHFVLDFEIFLRFFKDWDFFLKISLRFGDFLKIFFRFFF